MAKNKKAVSAYSYIHEHTVTAEDGVCLHSSIDGGGVLEASPLSEKLLANNGFLEGGREVILFSR